ncbi:sporulation protein YpjB [Oceanobacillus halophilus]|uniref:PTS EIIA type-1 domain-containing protein n=1 Tax=Oceanobacillus halophilus TaxID=930130 RepID=A0A495ACD9_9BACI|nr:sporulation protein YpjB [Oceanobacillus halophilus]RKQ37647.1 hypothetical protein D8M06_02260 [Oceanobacillus halophilus]
MLKVHLYQILKIFTIVVGILVFLHLGVHTVDANPVQESDVSKNNLDWVPFIWAVVIIGGSIGVTLSYVSWRKYKGEQRKLKKKKDKMID